MNTIKTIDSNELATATGGQQAACTPGTAFTGRFRGSDNYVGGSDMQANAQERSRLQSQGYSVVQGTRANGQGPSLDYTATCTR